jgi:hypothetical protein
MLSRNFGSRTPECRQYPTSDSEMEQNAPIWNGELATTFQKDFTQVERVYRYFENSTDLRETPENLSKFLFRVC